jgi:hypothetical protein
MGLGFPPPGVEMEKNDEGQRGFSLPSVKTGQTRWEWLPTLWVSTQMNEEGGLSTLQDVETETNKRITLWRGSKLCQVRNRKNERKNLGTKGVPAFPSSVRIEKSQGGNDPDPACWLLCHFRERKQKKGAQDHLWQCPCRPCPCCVKKGWVHCHVTSATEKKKKGRLTLWWPPPCILLVVGERRLWLVYGWWLFRSGGVR